MIDNSFHIITFGCQMNVHDSQWLARALEARGFCEAPLEEARVVVVNTCSVREKPEQKVMSTLGRIRQVTHDSPRVLVAVTGCVAQQLGEKLFSRQVRLVAGSDGISGAPQAIERLLDEPALRLSLLDFTSHYVEREPGADVPAPPVGFVNIMQGCDNFCAYCIVPYTRGRQKSRLTPAILDECRHLLDRGAREITLLGQNVNAFGRDRSGDGTSFAALLEKVAALPGLERLRYVTPHPKDMGPEDVAAFANIPQLCPRLHLPLQAGSDAVLRRMGRKYDSARYLELVASLRAARPDMALSTDLIVGFPGETEDDFAATLELMRASDFMSSFSRQPFPGQDRARRAAGPPAAPAGPAGGTFPALARRPRGPGMRGPAGKRQPPRRCGGRAAELAGPRQPRRAGACAPARRRPYGPPGGRPHHGGQEAQPAGRGPGAIMVEMYVEGLSLDPRTRKPIVILRQNDGKGLLPLWIGAMEAMTISLVLNGEELPRPLTHDLLLMVTRALKGRLTGVDIVDYRDDIYYAVLLLRGPEGLISVDCRPSDAIALALLASVPIRVKAEVFEKAAREQEPGSIHPATRSPAASDAATDMARSADARKEADTLAALLARGAVPEDLGEAAGPERLRELLRALEPVSRHKM